MRTAFLALLCCSACYGASHEEIARIEDPETGDIHRRIAVKCHRGISDCHQEATEACGGGYSIVDSSGRERRTHNNPWDVAPTWTGELIVDCGR